MKCSLILLLPSVFMFAGCSHTGYSQVSSKASEAILIRNAQGLTQYRIQDSNVFTLDGTRVARIDSSGNIFNTSGVRVGRVSKR